MEISAKEQHRKRISEGCYIQRFFRNKVFYGIDDQPLKRKVYRGKRDKNGKRKNEIFYVNEKQDVRIEEDLLMDCLNQILNKLVDTDKLDVNGWNTEASNRYFQIKEKNFLRNKEISVDDYKYFISESIEGRDCQTYENIRLRKKIHEGNFKDIIEKIEVYNTGVVCIFTNALEMSLQF